MGSPALKASNCGGQASRRRHIGPLIRRQDAQRDGSRPLDVGSWIGRAIVSTGSIPNERTLVPPVLGMDLQSGTCFTRLKSGFGYLLRGRRCVRMVSPRNAWPPSGGGQTCSGRPVVVVESSVVLTCQHKRTVASLMVRPLFGSGCVVCGMSVAFGA